jgi:ubiquinone biosynthesis monooxygenase Coq7
MNWDHAIMEFDRVLRTLAGTPQSVRDYPGRSEAGALDEGARAHAAALMRVNHSGEVCAQALYQGQALAAGDSTLDQALRKAADEEMDHLAWCRQRIDELGGHTSLLDPVWYGGSLAIGVAAAALGTRWNLGFLAETETQVEAHQEGHLAKLHPEDRRTREVIEVMRDDEARHAQMARDMGAAELPRPARAAMRAAARIMTTLSYRI